jgi:hypothetical protein
MDGSRARRELPPERAAAAKARLEQKNAEKKRAQAMGRDKENIREWWAKYMFFGVSKFWGAGEMALVFDRLARSQLYDDTIV